RLGPQETGPASGLGRGATVDLVARRGGVGRCYYLCPVRRPVPEGVNQTSALLPSPRGRYGTTPSSSSEGKAAKYFRTVFPAICISGAIAANGTKTNSRSSMRGWGSVKCGSSDWSVP